MSEAVKVMVRCRPLNTLQKDKHCSIVVEVDSKNHQIALNRPTASQPPKSFTYDAVFGEDSEQSEVYEQSAFSLVDSVLDGYNGTIFAYGQTGCGKTHTMMGNPDTEEGKGIIPRTFSQIMTVTKNATSKIHLIRCSFLQIYNEQIRDLLSRDNRTKLQLKQSPEKGVFVKDLSQIEVESISKMQQYMEIGFSQRSTRATKMNAESSRSHSIFTIYIDSEEKDQKGNQLYKAGKLNLVDLAGSERTSKTNVTGDGLKQANKINLSLSALGNVISALVDGKNHHIPYRDSKLTRLLQDSLGGNTKTIMIAAISPADYNFDETLSTLRYASRAKFIQNKPKINEDPKDAMLREYMEEIKKLKEMLSGKAPINHGVVNHYKADSSHDMHHHLHYDSSLAEQLRNKEDSLLREQEEKQLLREKLESLERVLGKGQQPNKKDEKEMEKLKKLKEKLKAQKKQQQLFKKQKKKRQEQLFNIQANYKSLNQEVDGMKQKFQQIKKRYIANLAEMKDIQDEHEDQKQDLLDNIRFKDKEIKKYESILKVLMNQDQLNKIVSNSIWIEETNSWKIPNFTYKDKFVSLPKLAQKCQENQTNIKEMIFRNSNTTKNTQRRSGENSFKVNSIIRNARDGYEMQNNKYRPNSITLTRPQLTPFKNQKNKIVADARKRRTERLAPIEAFSRFQ